MRTHRILTAAVAAALVLTACSTADNTEDPAPAPTTETAIPTPDSVTRPEARQSCTASLDRGVGAGDYPDRVTVACGEHSRTVSGDFSDRVSNEYGEGQPVERLIVVDDEVRAWLRDGEGSCLVLYPLSGPPVVCKASPTPAQNSTDGHTVVPRDETAPAA